MTRFDMPRRLVGEAIGTALLLATVVGSGIMGETLSAGNGALALLVNSIATGAMLAVLILIFGPLSFHFLHGIILSHLGSYQIPFLFSHTPAPHSISFFSQCHLFHFNLFFIPFFHYLPFLYPRICSLQCHCFQFCIPSYLPAACAAACSQHRPPRLLPRRRVTLRRPLRPGEGIRRGDWVTGRLAAWGIGRQSHLGNWVIG